MHEHGHVIASLKSGDITLMHKYPGIGRFYIRSIIFIGTFQTEDAINISLAASMGAGEFLIRDRAIDLLYLNEDFIIRWNCLSKLFIVRQHQCSKWFLSIEGRRGVIKLFFGCRENLINKMFWVTKVAEYGVQKLNFRVNINWIPDISMTWLTWLISIHHNILEYIH